MKKCDPKQRQLEAWFDTIHAMDPTSVEDNDHIVSCSFSEFYSQFALTSAGPIKGMRTIVRRKKPTVVVVQPNMPKLWLAKGHPKRRDYCRNALMMHKVFVDRAAFEAEMRGLAWDFEAAYEEFAASPDAPNDVRDDFRLLEYDDEGEVVENDSAVPELHGHYGMYLADRTMAAQRTKIGDYDWESDTSSNFTDADVDDSAKWMTRLNQTAPTVVDERVDVSKLNPAQAFVYRVVQQHHDAWAPDRPPLRALVCGTAGSGKTFLIRSIKQLLGDRCLVLAPTGVAADNIGGQTYHSCVPVPMADITREDIAPSEKRLASFSEKLDGVRYIVIDEMSMVGRRALGHISHLLALGTGQHNQPFGGISVILVGDHGQLPPVKDST